MRKNGGWRWREARPVDDGLAMSRMDGDSDGRRLTLRMNLEDNMAEDNC